MPQTELVNLLRLLELYGFSLSPRDFERVFSACIQYFEKRFDATWTVLGWPKVEHIREAYLLPLKQNEMLHLGDFLVVWLIGPTLKSQVGQDISWVEAIEHLCSSKTLNDVDTQNPENQDVANLLWLTIYAQHTKRKNQ